MPAGKQRVSEIVDFALLHSDEDACKTFNISRTALDRYKRSYKEHFGENADLLLKIKARYSADELKALSNGSSTDVVADRAKMTFDGDIVTFGAMGDSHIGSKYTDESFIGSALSEFDKQNCQFFVHTGDVTEGMSGRDGHCYELTHIGYSAQKDAAIQLFKDWKKPSYYLAGNHDCHTPDTECLTKRGWITYDNLTKDDKVLSYNIKEDKCEWQPITEIIIREHDGEMINFNFQTFKQHVTPNHRMLYSNYHDYMYFGHTMYQYGTAEFLANKPKTHVAHFKSSALSKVPDYPISDAMLRVVSWLLTDGSVHRTSDTVAGSYVIYQSKDITPIVECLTEAGLEYVHRVRDRDIKQVCGKTLKKKPLPEQNFRLTADSARKISEYLMYKEIPEWMYKLSDRQFDIVASVFLLANGSSTVKDKTRIQAFGLHGKYEFLNEVQILFQLHGFSTSLRKDTRGASVLDVCKRQDTSVTLKKGTTRDYYKGKVWCISTPLTNFMIRLNGRPSFTGNCWYMKKADMGADIVKDICKELPYATYLGPHEGSLLVNDCEVKLWHGEDTGSYATSYRLQKLVESFTGGTKPKVLLTGHTHKQGYFFDRHVHIVSTGSIQKQSAWMRYKRLPAHTGFYVIRMAVNEGNVVWFEPRFYPFYQ